MTADEKPDLAAVLEHYGVPVNTMRDSQMVRCPFGENHAHEDRTPSCSVSLSRGLYKCHSCGKSGDSWRLIMDKEECDFREARTIATSVGFATGGAGGGDEELRGSRYGARRKVPDRKGNRPRDGGYVPAWRRS